MLDARGDKKVVRVQRLEVGEQRLVVRGQRLVKALLGKVDVEKIVYCFDKKMTSIERHDKGTR
jgi:hypothetical protein